MGTAPLIACLDVQYSETAARAAIVVFQGWDSSEIVAQNTIDVPEIADYQPGEFYRRELPCLLAVLSSVSLEIQIVIVDGYVWLDEALKPGLGAKLYESLEQRTAIVGVAKTRFHGAPAVEVLRGQSHQPLFVTAVGIPAEEVATHIASMHGEFRIPTQLRRVDQLARGLTRAFQE